MFRRMSAWGLSGSLHGSFGLLAEAVMLNEDYKDILQLFADQKNKGLARLLCSDKPTCAGQLAWFNQS
jgi:hypothetical protein